MSTIRFELRKEKAAKDGLAPLRIIYQVKGTRKYYSTDEKTYADNWDVKKQLCIKGGLVKEAEAKAVNDNLFDLKRDIEKIEQRFILDGVAYDEDMVMKKLKEVDAPKEKKSASAKEVYDFIDRYIEENQDQMVKGSLTVYKSLKARLQEYENKKQVKIAFEEITPQFFSSFQKFLFSLRKLDSNGKQVPALNDITVAKQLSTLKTFLNYARGANITVPDNYRAFKIKRDNDLEVIALTQHEYNTLFNIDLSKRPAWDQVRNLFCFSCNTGLRYSDLRQLRRDHIKNGVIDLRAIKTGNKHKIPLTPDALTILDKYKDSPAPLGEIISNQKCNEHLAKICEHAGIDSPQEIVRKFATKRTVQVYKKYDLIRMHCGRKSYATISIERGMSIPEVMKVGGWKDYKSFSRYMNVTDESAKKAMDMAYPSTTKANLIAV